MDNPYFQGVQQAKRAVGYEDPNRQDALQSALAQLGSSIGRQSTGRPRRGLLDNLAQFGPAIADANQTYQQAEQADHWGQKRHELEERRLADGQTRAVLRDAQREQKYATEQGWKAKKYEQDERKLAIDAAYKKQKLAGQATKDLIKIDGKQYDAITDKKDLRDTRNHAQQLGDSKLQLESIQRQMGELQQATQDNIFPAIGGLAKYTNMIKDPTGRVLGAERLQQETAIREALRGDITKFNMALEKALTGRAMTQGMYDRLKSSYPDLDTDDLPTINHKMQNIGHELDGYYRAANMSAKHGAYITPYDLAGEESDTLPIDIRADAPTTVEMVDPSDGQVYPVPPKEVPEWEAKGMVLNDA